ncbi:hypothetical protein HanHA300_Chr09g0301991 [Helianthus annuus]|uniref:uncharacterized protein LOC110877259 isoform X2 n=1 Tax=Helianthus annuus TaxID=4232 RepID=UPI000B8F3A49|nr:uncharacterized protein LOC110877259 isoform X2 [Helianthus annuus]KAJ0524572.1 hypothetical protein HanHA300_Chr09g0301991 [Helianthus annuus]
MADTKAKEAKISVKVIIDKVNRRVVYAEADHTFVDILFSFMTLPLGTIARILGKHNDQKFEALGNLKNLYQSLENFPECYLSTEECKHMLLNPRSYSCQSMYSTCTKAKCGNCGKLMNQEVPYQKPKVCVGSGSVFVSERATFIVTDDLCVMPYTSANSIRLLTGLGITDKSCLEDLMLDMGREQIVNLLKVALSLDAVFTYLVFNRVVPGQSSILHQTDMKKEESATPKMRLEVSLQKSTGKLLFVEAEEDFVDFLFSVLSIPLGTVIGELLKGASSVTCIDNIFKSVSNMSVGRRHLKSHDIKDMLLKPHIGQQYSSRHQFFPLSCTPLCWRDCFHKDPRIDNGLLKQSGLFIVTDDLIVTPSSSYSTLNTLNDLKVPFDDIEKYETSIGLIEGLRMLKASLRSRSTLTDSLNLDILIK